MSATPPELRLARGPSVLGTMLGVCDELGRVRALDFEDHRERMQRLLRLHYGARAEGLTHGRTPPAVRRSLDAFFGGELDALHEVDAVTGGTGFQRHVWAELRTIPAGETRSYGEIAAAIGRPLAVRAVGAANGANPVALIVPCHRVMGSDGGLTGKGGGLGGSRWLLRHEGAASLPRAR